MSCGHEATRLYQSCDNNSITTSQWFLAGVDKALKPYRTNFLSEYMYYSTISDSYDTSDYY